MASLNSKEFYVKSILIFNKIVHNTSDIVLNFQVKKPKINLFMNEKPQNLKIAIKSLKLKLKVLKKRIGQRGWSRSAVVEVCPSSLRSSDRIVYYYYIQFECNDCIR